MSTISVCIPTYNRPQFLEAAVRSCAAQTLRPFEIVIGDDSTNDATERIIERLASETSLRIDYRRNEPRLRQNRNVNEVFVRATGSHLVLLHDDDLLTPNALESLIRCWDLEPQISGAFGMQIVMTEEGVELPAESIALNAKYGRRPSDAGLQLPTWRVGLSQQLPNDGYMLLSSVAKATLWKPEAEVGFGGEFEFGLRLGLLGYSFYFVDAYTSVYRYSSASISRSSSDDAALRSYLIAETAELPPDAEPVRRAKLERSAPVAMTQALRLGRRRLAWRIYLSRSHSWRRRLSPGGVRRLVWLFVPTFRKRKAESA